MPEDKTPPYQSGFCGIGHHEGTTPKSPSGKPMKTCNPTITYRGKTWYCNCKCHKELDRLFEMTGMERTLQENPEYIPEKGAYVMPSLEERALSLVSRDTTPPVIIESPLPTHVPATIERHFKPTASGRAGRGQLELRVKIICDRWVVDQPENSCTPQWISDQIVAEWDPDKVPSVGAIGAVFDRWTEIGFALIAKKPVRFIGYTDDGVKLGLDALKLRFRDKSKAVPRR